MKKFIGLLVLALLAFNVSAQAAPTEYPDDYVIQEGDDICFVYGCLGPGMINAIILCYNGGEWFIDWTIGDAKAYIQSELDEDEKYGLGACSLLGVGPCDCTTEENPGEMPTYRTCIPIGSSGIDAPDEDNVGEYVYACRADPEKLDKGGGCINDDECNRDKEAGEPVQGFCALNETGKITCSTENTNGGRPCTKPEDCLGTEDYKICSSTSVVKPNSRYK
ncbi:MAG: hypothetical protein V1834_03595, partial [Candidatus Micrarchaeota archaeon]